MALDVGRITESETADAIGVLARGMRDNPLHVAALGDDPAHRVDALRQLFSGMIPMQPEPLRASEDGEVVGLCGLIALPECMVHAFGSLPTDQFPPMLKDAADQARLVETDKADNVGFYEKFGFVTVGKDDVIGVPNWFMRREAR
jgi:hypothetical protein